MTILTAYQATFQKLLKNGSPRAEARASARILVDEISHATHAHLTRGDELLTTSQLAQLEAALRELENGRPLAYVLGTQHWHRLVFQSDERALVPRPETELLVEEVVKRVRKGSTPNAVIADLGTGSGCIAISLAHELPHATIYATDVSSEALALARENASTLVPESIRENRLHFMSGVLGQWAAPLREYSSSGAGQFDFIVSNPPYIARADIENLQPQVRDFEPRLALDGGEDGLDCYRGLAAQCGVLLNSKGALLCELGAGQFQDARVIFETQNWRVENPIFDFAGIARVLVACPLP